MSLQPATFDRPGGPGDPARLPGDSFDIPFAEAIAWAEQRRAVLPSEFYGARLQAVRARSFAVTGLATLDQVQQVADAASAATASGQTFREWQRTVLASDASGELFSLGRVRRELIFRNAVQTHYGIGRTIQQRENAAARPYLMWDAINDSRTRPAHRAMDGHIAPMDAPIWRRWNAPAGHQCRCTRIALTEAQARARGYPKAEPGVEPDKGWEGDPTEGNEDLVRVVQARRDACAVGFAAKRGRSTWRADCSRQGADSLLSVQRAITTPGPMPEPRATGLHLLPAGQTQAFYFERVMEALGSAGATDAGVDSVPGYPLNVSRLMFTDHKTGASKIEKRGRAAYLPYLAETILRPDEAWLKEGGFEDRTLTLLGRYLRRGEAVSMVAVFKKDGAAWEGWSGFQSQSEPYVDSLRDGVLIFRRPS